MSYTNSYPVQYSTVQYSTVRYSGVQNHTHCLLLVTVYPVRPSSAFGDVCPKETLISARQLLMACLDGATGTSAGCRNITLTVLEPHSMH